MIDIHTKSSTLRYARARGILHANPSTIEKVEAGSVPKGDVASVARSTAIQAGKQTSEWIVFCHPLPLDWIDATTRLHEDRIEFVVEARTIWKTGVEMEAITAVSAGLLNMYDMLKPLDDSLEIGSITLVEKEGGYSDYEDSFEENLNGAVLVISDGTFEGTREDKSGKIIQEFLSDKPVDVEVYDILPDEEDRITARLTALVDEEDIDLIFTTGGTGLGPRDVTPEATRQVIEREVPGVAEAIRAYGMERTPYAMLSRESAGVRGTSLIVNLPGSSRGAEESLQALFPGLLHIFPMLWGGKHKKHK